MQEQNPGESHAENHQFIQEIHDQLSEIGQDVQERLSKQESNRAAIFFLGDTGVGKSSLINYLTGKPLTVAKKKFSQDYLIEGLDSTTLKIGHTSSSQTKLIDYCNDDVGNLYVDTAGFEDTEGVKAEIINSLALKLVYNYFTCRKIVMVLNSYSFQVNRAQILKRNLMRATNYFGMDIKDILFVISKAKKGTQYKQWMIDILKKDDSPYISKNRSVLIKMIEQSVVLPFYEPTRQDFESTKEMCKWYYAQKDDRREILAEVMTIRIAKNQKLAVTFDGVNSRKVEKLSDYIRQIFNCQLGSIKGQIETLEDGCHLNHLKEIRYILDQCKSRIFLNNCKHKGEQFEAEPFECLKQITKKHANEESKQKILQKIDQLSKKLMIYFNLFDRVYMTFQDEKEKKPVMLDVNEKMFTFLTNNSDTVCQGIYRKYQKQIDVANWLKGQAEAKYERLWHRPFFSRLVNGGV